VYVIFLNEITNLRNGTPNQLSYPPTKKKDIFDKLAETLPVSKLKNFFELWRPSFKTWTSLEVLSQVVKSMKCWYCCYCCIFCSIFDFPAHSKGPKKYFLKFVNYVGYIKMDSKNSATPETLETTVAAGTSSSWDGSNSRDNKNSNSRTYSSTLENWNDKGHPTTTGTPESVERETLKGKQE
jgi:hypothetical protein